MKSTAFTFTLILLSAAAHADDPASVLGHAFGSLGCVDLQNPDGKAICEARALSNGSGCQGLSSQAMRDKCLDEGLYPTSSRDRPKHVRKTVLIDPFLKAETKPAVPLSESEIKRFEEWYGLKKAAQ